MDFSIISTQITRFILHQILKLRCLGVAGSFITGLLISGLIYFLGLLLIQGSVFNLALHGRGRAVRLYWGGGGSAVSGVATIWRPFAGYIK
jgi:hypothetical protein